MSTVKRLAVILLVLLASCLPVIRANAHAVDIDGKINPLEWLDSAEFTVISLADKSNCGVMFTFLNLRADDENNRLYLAFKTELDRFAEADGTFGFELYINGGERIASFYDSALDEYDPELYSLEAAYLLNPNHNQFDAELCVGVKFGLPQTLVLGVRVYDCEGRPSNLYDITVRTAENSGDSASANEEKTTAEKTTKATTTATTTTKSTTTATTTTTQRTSTSQTFTTVPFVPYTRPAVSETPTARLSVPAEAEPPRGKTEPESGTTEPETEPDKPALSSGTTAARTEEAEWDGEPPPAVPVTFAAENGAARMGAKKAAGIALASVLLLGAGLVSAYLGFAPSKKSGAEKK